MSDLDFALPRPGASLPEFEEAARRLSAVQLTEDQIWRGYCVHSDAAGNKMAVLRAWAETQGLRPAHIAAHAIVIRGYAVMEALDDAAMWKGDDVPKVLIDLLKGPILPADLGWFEALAPQAEQHAAVPVV